MTKLFYLLSIAILLGSCSENPKNTTETPALIPTNEVKGTFDSEIQRPVFSAIASSYKTAKMPNYDAEMITDVLIGPLNCLVEDIAFCDEFTRFFDNSSQYTFAALEEYATVVEGRKNVLQIKGELFSSGKKVSAILFFTVFEDNFKADIVVETAKELVASKQETITIRIKGKKSR